MSREPGDGLKRENIYEVWGDLVENAAAAAPALIHAIYAALQEAHLAEYFNCREEYARHDGRPFLVLQWGSFEAHIDARPFGRHLDVYGILTIRRGLLDHPDPAVRIASLEGWERRDLQIFQTILKHAMEEALDALDEGRLL
ncbi:MAG: hypothetical protein D6796_06990 [Caldilineae bacterium]|nr:MAG: hypothetical protein D6796_06990 [Caldilineae bacterium]